MGHQGQRQGSQKKKGGGGMVVPEGSQEDELDEWDAISNDGVWMVWMVWMV